jgi:hypothetical protein
LIGLFDDGPDIVIKSDFFTTGEGVCIFEQLKAQMMWRQDVVCLGHREVLQPRLAAWYGDSKTYAYSGIGNRRAGRINRTFRFIH